MNIEEQVLKTFCDVCNNFIGNTNSLHKEGVKSLKLEKAATLQICDIFKLHGFDIIYTSGRSEANSLAILGIYNLKKIVSSEVIIFSSCSNSVYEAFKSLKNVIIREVKNYDEFLKYLNDRTLFVCFSDYDLGVKITSISNKKFYTLYDCYSFVGDYNIFDFISLDLLNYSNLLGIGFLAKRKNIVIEPIIYGGKSSTVYRSGTVALPEVVAFSKAIRLLNNYYKNADNING